jgi:hypothetical protein
MNLSPKLTPRQQRIAGMACLLGSLGVAFALARIKPVPMVPAIATSLAFWIGVALLLPRMTRR